MSVPFLLWLERPDVIGLQFGTAYKVAIPFIIFFVVMLFRPWGIVGRRPAFARRSYFIEQIARLLGERRRSETPTGAANGGRGVVTGGASTDVSKQAPVLTVPW